MYIGRKGRSTSRRVDIQGEDVSGAVLPNMMSFIGTTSTRDVTCFARAKCEDCGHERLIPFSCKGRGICPSCNAPRMCEVAAHLTDHVLPHVPARQWVLSVALLTALAGCGTPGTPTGSPPSPDLGSVSAVDQLLDRSGLESIISARAGAFTRQVALLAGDLNDEELERLVPAVQSAFASESLRETASSFIESEAPNDGTVSEVLGWIAGGANAEVRRVVDAYEPPFTLQEYTQSLTTSPPEGDRIRLVAEWARIQGAGDFFVLLEEALNEAAHAVWAEFRPDAPPFAPARGGALRTRLMDSFNASVVSLLYSHETVPDSVLQEATVEYATDAGQWYVQAYSLAVAEAMRTAGQRVVTELRSPGG